MSDKTVAFKDATGYLKEQGLVKYSELIKKLGITRNQFNSMRQLRTHPKDELIQNLKRLYPIVETFFETNNEVGEEAVQYIPKKIYDKNEALIDSLREVIAVKDELLKMKDDKINDLKKYIEAAEEAQVEYGDKVRGDKVASSKSEHSEES